MHRTVTIDKLAAPPHEGQKGVNMTIGIVCIKCFTMMVCVSMITTTAEKVAKIIKGQKI